MNEEGSHLQLQLGVFWVLKPLAVLYHLCTHSSPHEPQVWPFQATSPKPLRAILEGVGEQDLPLSPPPSDPHPGLLFKLCCITS